MNDRAAMNVKREQNAADKKLLDSHSSLFSICKAIEEIEVIDFKRDVRNVLRNSALAWSFLANFWTEI